MKKIIKSLGLIVIFLSFLLGSFSLVSAQEQSDIPDSIPSGSDGGSNGGGTESEKKCTGIKLNTDFPIIGNCIESANATGAFPTMMSALTKIVMSLILVVCFIFIIVAGVLWASAGEDSGKTKTAWSIIERVAITILLLGFSGVILRLINPNFFG